MLTLQQMNYILVLNEFRHFQRASEKCFITQPTLSMQLKKAEENLGFAIFDRSRQPMELTVFGEKLIPILREIISETDKIQLIKEQMQGSFKERIKLGIIPTIAVYMIPDLYSQWYEKLNDIQLTIVEQKTEELLDALDKKELDAIIIAGPHYDPKCKINPLYTEEILAYIPDMESKDITTDQLNTLHPWLLSTGNCLRNQMIRFCQLKGEDYENEWNYEGGNIDLLLSMTDQHGGYTLVPEFHHIDKRRSGGIHHILSGENKTHPAREVIAISPLRSMKWASIERIIRDIQLKYAKPTNNDYEIVQWK